LDTSVKLNPIKVILLDHQNNYVERLSIDDNAEKSFNILAISLNILHNYFDGPNKIIVRSVSSWIFRFFSRTVLFRRACMKKRAWFHRYKIQTKFLRKKQKRVFLKIEVFISIQLILSVWVNFEVFQKRTLIVGFSVRIRIALITS